MNKINYSKYNDVSGIYCINNTINGKVYIGSATDLYQRNNYHVNALKNNKHHNKYLQSSYNKYGPGSFVFEVKEVFKSDNESELRLLENKYMQFYNSLDRNFGYNLVEELGVSRKYSAEVIETMSGANSKGAKPVWCYEIDKDILTLYPCRTIQEIGGNSAGVCAAVRKGRKYKGCMWFCPISDPDMTLEIARKRSEEYKERVFISYRTRFVKDELIVKKRIQDITSNLKSDTIKGGRKSSYKKRNRLPGRPHILILNIETGIFYNTEEAAKLCDISRVYMSQLLVKHGMYKNFKRV